MKFLSYLLSNIGGNWDNMLWGPQHIIIIPTLVVATTTQCGATVLAGVMHIYLYASLLPMD